MIEIIPVRDEDEKALIEAAVEDNHVALQGTHIVKKGGEIVGYISLGVMPALHFWMHTKKTSVFDSRRMMLFCEEELRRMGARWYWLPVTSTTPFAPYIERFGFTRAKKIDRAYVKHLY